MRIVAFAYACEPGAGSEPGAGWTWSRMLATVGETWIITRANNAPRIAIALQDLPEAERPHFLYVDLPSWAMFWKRGQRGVRLYYLLWQVAAARRARRLHRQLPFDLAWHLTLANAWLGSLAPLAGRRSVYGPVGGGVRPPWRLAPALGVRGTAYELARAAAQGVGRYANPIARLAWRRADLILVQNAETAKWLPRRHRPKTSVFPNVVLDGIDGIDGIDGVAVPTERSDGGTGPVPGRTAVFAGRLLPLKGVALAIRAVALLPEWRLLIVGGGPDERRLRQVARRFGVERRVEFLGWRPRADLFRIMRQDAEVLLFPSLHEEAGWVVVEALACGRRVVCLDLGGPPVLAGFAGLAAPASGGSERAASALAGLLASPEVSRSALALARAREWGFDARTERLHEVLRRRLGISDAREEEREEVDASGRPLPDVYAPAASSRVEGMEAR